MCTIPCCSKCCGFISATAIVFLFVLGLLLKHQPFYTAPSLHAESESKAAQNCFIAMGLYAVTLTMSVGGLFWEKYRYQMSTRL
ncbi:unnamed protein product [Chrysoparadoxa australica]